MRFARCSNGPVKRPGARAVPAVLQGDPAVSAAEEGEQSQQAELSGGNLRLHDRGELLDGILPLQPGVQAAEQRPDAGDALSLQRQRHTGARRLVRSGADQDDIPIARDVLERSGNRLGSDASRSRDGVGRACHLECRA